MEKMYVIYRSENGGFGYKPCKVALQEGTRICIDREKMVFAKVLKVVEETPERMRHYWEASKASCWWCKGNLSLMEKRFLYCFD